MSSCQVTSATVNAIASFICYSRENNSYVGILQREGGLSFAEDAEELSLTMVRLNTAALCARYGQGQVVPHHVFAVNMVSKTQAFKLLGGWLYQCAEGQIPTESMYKAFKTVHDMLACEIVRAMHGYDDLPRDLPETTSRAIPLSALIAKPAKVSSQIFPEPKPVAINLSASPCSVASRNVKRKMSAHLETLIANATGGFGAKPASKREVMAKLDVKPTQTRASDGIVDAWTSVQFEW